MENCSVWLVGLGSDHGDDRAGWDVIAHLRNSVPDCVRVEAISDPFALATIPPGCELLIVVDGSRGLGLPGSLHQFEWPHPRLIVADGVSSHGLGVVDALQLAEALGRLPRRTIILAIEGEAGQPCEGLSPAVQAVIPDAAVRVMAEIAARANLADARVRASSGE